MLFNIKSNYTKWDSLKEFIYYKFIQPIKILHETITRIIKWLPILIKDRNWENSYILIILQNKIRFTRECIDKYGNEEERSKRKKIKHMRTAELLLERLAKEEYTEQDWHNHILEFPREDPILNGEYYILAPSSDEDIKQAKRIMDKEKYMWNQDWEYLSKHLKKHIKTWWD